MSSRQPSTAYLFSYFLDNGEDGLHFATSADGLKWTGANAGRSFLQPAVGSKLMRDPSITPGPDGLFHMAWTTGWWDNGIGIAHSTDLITWSPQQFLPVMAHMPDAQNCWAPELFFDEDNARYLIVWATTMVREPDMEHRLYYVETKDFTSYSNTKMFYDGGFSVIDGFVVKAAPGRFVLMLKDERELPRPTKHLRVAEAPRADGPYGAASPPISIDWVEGPSVLRRGNNWIAYYDEYTRNRYGAIESVDLRTWRPANSVEFPPGMRHGTAFEVPAGVAAHVAAHGREPR